MDTNLSMQFGYLVEQNTGVKLEKIIEQILESDLININDLLVKNNILNVKIFLIYQLGIDNKYSKTLYLFSSENYITYKDNPNNYIPLSDKMIFKLKMITLLDLAKDEKNLKLEFLIKILDIKEANYFELDSIIFEAHSQGLINGKIDQKMGIFKVLAVKAREYVPDIKNLEYTVDKWIDNLVRSSNYIKGEVENLRNFNDSFKDLMHREVKY